MAKLRRPFNPEAVARFADGRIKAVVGLGSVAWRCTVLVPVTESRPGEEAERIATDVDLEIIERLLTNDFDGLTILPDPFGYGLREGQIELNTHRPFVIYASATTPSGLYFQALRKELEDSLVQECVLVERHEVRLH